MIMIRARACHGNVIVKRFLEKESRNLEAGSEINFHEFLKSPRFKSVVMLERVTVSQKLNFSKNGGKIGH